MPFVSTYCCPCEFPLPGCGCFSYTLDEASSTLDARVIQVLAPDTIVCGCLLAPRWQLRWDDRQRFWRSDVVRFCTALGVRREAMLTLHCLPRCMGTPGVGDYYLVLHTDCGGQYDSFAWPATAPPSTCGPPVRLVFDVRIDRVCCTGTPGGAVSVRIEVT